MRRKTTAAVGVIGTFALLAAACGEAPEEDASDVEKDFKACMVTDVGGPDDRSFNASAWQGLEAAVEKEPAIEIEMAESKAEDDYEPNLVGFAENGDCDFILAVGGLMGDALKIVAEEFPDQRFGIVDANVPLDNVFSMEFDTAQSSFLAGYLAAGMSKTGVVATYGGLEIPPVTIFMDGYAQGIEYYNEEEDADVKLLGWDYEKQNGSFTGNFDSSDDGQSQTETFVSQDADVIFPVAGGTGVGTPTVTQDHDDVYSIWVDVDGAVSVPNYKDQFLSTSVKNMPDAVRDAVVNARDDGPMDGRTVGTLENEGVSLAPLHEDVPDELASKLTEIQQMIIDGDIPVVSEAQPDPVE